MSRRIEDLIKGSLVASLLGITLVGAAAPVAERPRGPIKITAQRAELEHREYALYRGKVRMESQGVVLTGDRLELRQPARGQYEARLTGAPAQLDHPGDAKGGPPVSASAATIVYDTRSATVDLSGGVQLARGTDQLTSDQVRYNLDARRITANGSGAGQVQITITPPAPEKEPQGTVNSGQNKPAPAPARRTQSLKPR
jgi:lipopolysaccharide export system protein LptA